MRLEAKGVGVVTHTAQVAVAPTSLQSFTPPSQPTLCCWLFLEHFNGFFLTNKMICCVVLTNQENFTLVLGDSSILVICYLLLISIYLYVASIKGYGCSLLTLADNLALA